MNVYSIYSSKPEIKIFKDNKKVAVKVAKPEVIDKAPMLSTIDKIEESADKKASLGWQIIAKKMWGTPNPDVVKKEAKKEPSGKKEIKGFMAKAGAAFAQIGKTLKALPSFVYPSIHGANAAEKQVIISTLDKLPLKDATSVHSIYMSNKLLMPNGIDEAAGLARNMGPVHTIQLSKPWLYDGVVIHEVGHTKDFSTGLGGMVGTTSSKGPFGKGPWVTNYAKTNHWEDFAESYEAFHNNPQHLNNTSMAKYNAVAASEKQSLLEKAFDNKPVREAGKVIGDTIGKVPFLREALQVIGFVLGPLQINKGYNQLQDGYNNNDPKKKLDGKLNMAAGTMYTIKPLALFGLVTDIGHWFVNRSIKKGNLTPQEAEKKINQAFKPFTQSIGNLAYAINTFKQA